jgi:hypothetical protein
MQHPDNPPAYLIARRYSTLSGSESYYCSCEQFVCRPRMAVTDRLGPDATPREVTLVDHHTGSLRKEEP